MSHSFFGSEPRRYVTAGARFGHTIAYDPRPRTGDRRLFAYGAGSILFHLLLGALFLLQPRTSVFGTYGPDVGTGLQVSLVSGFAGGGGAAESATPVDPLDLTTKDEADQDAGRPRPEAQALSLLPSVDRPEGVADEAKVTNDSRAEGVNGEAAGRHEGVASAGDALGGSPTAMSDLLAQIARCLPIGFRPHLAFGQLLLTVGPDGRLRTAPEVRTGLAAVSRDERSAADRIVQAALQCGPYAHPDALNRTVALSADFSAVR